MRGFTLKIIDRLLKLLCRCHFQFFEIILLTILSLSSGAVNSELVPWPFGQECSFPWQNLSGVWKSQDSSLPYLVRFEVKNFEEGIREFQVMVYRSSGDLVGRGVGLIYRGDRVIRAQISGLGLERDRKYWILLRTFAKNQKNTCENSQQMTLISFRSIESKGVFERHFEVIQFSR